MDTLLQPQRHLTRTPHGRSTVKARQTAPVPRLALTREEAAASLGMSLSKFQRDVQPELPLIRKGALVLVSIRELELWVERSSSLATGHR